jgi:hypothetical protein
MTDDNILTSDDEFKGESSNSIMTGENLNEEDDLDFYDFLEAVSDKIDNITNQSKKQSNFIYLFKKKKLDRFD